MAKHKSVTAVRLSEIGRCIRLLHGLRSTTPYNDTVRRGMTICITALGQYKRAMKDADELTIQSFSNKAVQAMGETFGGSK